MILLLILVVFLMVGGSLYVYLRNRKMEVEKTFVKILPVLHNKNVLLPPLENIIKPYMEEESKILHDVIEMEEEVERDSVVNDFLSEEAEIEMEKETKKVRRKKNPNKLTMNERILMENDLTEYIERIFEMTDEQETLKTDSRLEDLKSEFKDTAIEFNKAREVFNKKVSDYNNAVTSFPTSVMAKLFKFKPIVLLSAIEWNNQTEKEINA